MNFRIGFDSNMAAGASRDAAAMDKLEKQLRKGETALSVMEKQMKALQRAGSVDVATYKQLESAIAKKKDGIAALTGQMVRLGPSAEAARESQEALSKTLGVVSIGLGLVAAGAVAAIGAMTKLVQVGAEFSEQRMDNVNMLQTLFRSQEAAEHTYDVIVDVTKRVAISQTRALEVADAMAKAGVVSGDAMVRAVESVGKAEAARKGAGQAIQAIMERSERARSTGYGMAGFSVSRDELRQAGLTYADLAKTLAKQTGRGVQEAATALMHGRVSVAAGLDALNATIDEKLGPLAEKKFYTLGAAMQRMRDRIGGLFARMDTGPIARAFDALGRMFDESTVSGYTLQTVLKGAFAWVSEGVEKAMPYVQTLADGLMLMALRVYNALYPVRQRFAELFGGDGMSVDGLEGLLLKITDGVAGLAAGVAYLWPVFETTFRLIMLPVDALRIGFGMVAEVASSAFALLITGWNLVAGNISYDKAKAIAGGIISGLVDGILNGAGEFVGAIRRLADSGLEAFKAVFGIRSPSVVMAQQGRMLNAGLTKGIDDSASGPTDAMADSIGGAGGYAQPATSAASITNNSSSSRSSSAIITFAEGSINITGVTNAEQLRAELPRVMADVFEQLGLTMGAEVPAT